MSGKSEIRIGKVETSTVGVVASGSGDKSTEIGEIEKSTVNVEHKEKHGNGEPMKNTIGSGPVTEPLSDGEQNKKTSIWDSGSFFIVLLLVIFVVIIVTIKLLPVTVLPFVIIGAILLYAVVGAFLLRSNGQLSEKNFLELMLMSFKNVKYLFKKEDSEKPKKNNRKPKK